MSSFILKNILFKWVGFRLPILSFHFPSIGIVAQYSFSDFDNACLCSVVLGFPRKASAIFFLVASLTFLSVLFMVLTLLYIINIGRLDKYIKRSRLFFVYRNIFETHNTRMYAVPRSLI